MALQEEVARIQQAQRSMHMHGTPASTSPRDGVPVPVPAIAPTHPMQSSHVDLVMAPAPHVLYAAPAADGAPFAEHGAPGVRACVPAPPGQHMGSVPPTPPEHLDYVTGAEWGVEQCLHADLGEGTVRRAVHASHSDGEVDRGSGMPPLTHAPVLGHPQSVEEMEELLRNLKEIAAELARAHGVQM